MYSSITSDETTVSVIVPCLNEIRYINVFLDSLLTQELTGMHLEVLIADGMSRDGTREILEAYSAKHSHIRIIDNPHGIVSKGLNRAIAKAKGDIIIRMDVHAEYASDYIYQCINIIKKTGADNVGGSARTKAEGYIQKAVSLAYHSPFAVGGARFHKIDHTGYVDTVPYGCWRRSTFDKIGMFDEELVRNQDDELNLRIIRSGGKIWQSPKINSWYYPRSSIKDLFKQYMQYGYWKVRVIQKHKFPASLRHLIPGGFVGSLIVFGVLSPFFTFTMWLFLALIGLYCLASVLATIITCRKLKLFKFLPVLPFVFGTYHFGYGYGFLRGMIDFVILRKTGSNTFSEITRGCHIE